jgi:hypothetical protein
MKSRWALAVLVAAALVGARWASAGDEACDKEHKCAKQCDKAAACEAEKASTHTTAVLTGHEKEGTKDEKKEGKCCGECKLTCPVSAEKVTKDSPSLDYAGGKVYLKCEDCVAKFKADPTKYALAANLQLVLSGQAKQVGCPLSGGKTDSKVTLKVAGVDVAFCCGGCKDKVAKAAEKEQLEMVFAKGYEKAFKLEKARKQG